MAFRLEYILFQLLKFIIQHLSLKSARRLGIFIGTVGYFCVPKRRNIALDNLQHAFPEKTIMERKTIAHHAFQSYAVAMIEFLWFPKISQTHLREIVSIKGLDVYRECNKRRKGVVVLSAHFGSWELDALALGLAGGVQASIVVQTQSNSYIDKIINNHRTMFGNKVVPMGVSVREIIRALQRTEVVALAADQSGPQEGPFVEFFGRMTATHQGPAIFALRMGCPILMSLAIRNPDYTYTINVEEVPSTDLCGDSEANVLELTKRHTRVLEGYIRQYPDQWLWMHRRWKHSLERNETIIKELG
ncbi:MAG: lysophospholipid acyltransferase family protein [Bacteroidota bacterium]